MPAPEETAQALVIKGAESEGGATHKRRQSISHFFRRKFSRKKDCKLMIETTAVDPLCKYVRSP